MCSSHAVPFDIHIYNINERNYVLYYVYCRLTVVIVNVNNSCIIL